MCCKRGTVERYSYAAAFFGMVVCADSTRIFGKSSLIRRTVGIRILFYRENTRPTSRVGPNGGISNEIRIIDGNRTHGFGRGDGLRTTADSACRDDRFANFSNSGTNTRNVVLRTVHEELSGSATGGSPSGRVPTATARQSFSSDEVVRHVERPSPYFARSVQRRLLAVLGIRKSNVSVPMERRGTELLDRSARCFSREVIRSLAVENSHFAG